MIFLQLFCTNKWLDKLYKWLDKVYKLTSGIIVQGSLNTYKFQVIIKNTAENNDLFR